ncbi:hypothetical protein AAEX63_05380 [Luteococcus sp. H138]|uniref:hypothetical protein n=1 Tax=unclassified Luteococcus TaxID=2639923 RepID=UPI00313EC110
MAEFVGEGLDGLGVVDVVPDPDGSGGVVGVSVRAVAVTALQTEALLADESGQGLPEAVGCLAGEQGGAGWFGDGVAGGLADVEDASGFDPDDLGCHHRFALVIDDGCAIGLEFGEAAGDGREDADAVFAPGDLAVEALLPGAVAGDQGGVGALRPDQDGVVEAVLVEAARDAQPGLPLLGAGEVGDLVGDLRVQVLELFGLFCLLGFGGWSAGHHCTAGV